MSDLLYVAAACADNQKAYGVGFGGAGNGVFTSDLCQGLALGQPPEVAFLGMPQTIQGGLLTSPQDPQEFGNGTFSLLDPAGAVKDKINANNPPPPPDSQEQAVQVTTNVVVSADPNDITTTGFGTAGFVAANDAITYQIDFTNSAQEARRRRSRNCLSLTS